MPRFTRLLKSLQEGAVPFIEQVKEVLRGGARAASSFSKTPIGQAILEAGINTGLDIITDNQPTINPTFGYQPPPPIINRGPKMVPSAAGLEAEARLAAITAELEAMKLRKKRRKAKKAKREPARAKKPIVQRPAKKPVVRRAAKPKKRVLRLK